MANILIIGGAGFIGSSLVKILSCQHELCIYDKPEVSNSRVLPMQDKIQVYYGMLSDFDHLCDIIDKNSIEIVLHLASGLLPNSTFESYLDEYKEVIVPTIRLLPVFSKRKIQIIYFSSGGTVYGIPNNLPVKEHDQLRPICYYGFSKQILEEAIQFENRNSGLNFLILRPSNAYGPGQNIHGKQGIIAVALGKILNNEKIVIWGDGNVVRDFIYINDLACSVLELIRLKVENEILNIGSGHGCSVNEILEELRNIFARDIDVEYSFSRTVDVPSIILDNSKLLYIASVKFTPLTKGIQEMIQCVKADI